MSSCHCTLPAHHAQEAPGGACRHNCECDGARECHRGACRGEARPPLYAPFVTDRFAPYTGYDSSLAPPNDACTVALYNYHINAASSCSAGETCRDVGRICARLFDNDTDVERCVFANSFASVPGRAVDQAATTEDLNRMCCGPFPPETCHEASTPACRWDASEQRGVHLDTEKEGVCKVRDFSGAESVPSTACSALDTQELCGAQPALCRWDPAPARGADVPLDAACCTTQAHQLRANPGVPYNTGVLARYFVPADTVFEI